MLMVGGRGWGEAAHHGKAHACGRCIQAPCLPCSLALSPAGPSPASGQGVPRQGAWHALPSIRSLPGPRLSYPHHQLSPSCVHSFPAARPSLPPAWDLASPELAFLGPSPQPCGTWSCGLTLSPAAQEAHTVLCP